MSTATDLPTLRAPASPRTITRPVAAVAARVSFRQPATSLPHVDAAWWPHSSDLEAELPSLLDAVWSAGRDVYRVSYSFDAWQPTPRRLRIAGHLIKLGGFVHQEPSMISLRGGSSAERIDVLVIPPDTDPAVAETAMKLVSRSGANERAAKLLEIAAADTG